MGTGENAAARVVLVTAPDRDVGLELARGMVQGGLAACVNLLPGVVSVYRWEGRLMEEGEVLLLVKTTQDRVPDIQAFLAGSHPYDLPECVALAPQETEARYLAWLQAACARDAEDRAE